MLSPQQLDEPITQHMRTDFTRLHADQTVGEALEAIRRQGGEGQIIYFYVVDEDQRLVGVVPTRRLLLSGPDQRVREIMLERVVSIPPVATVLDACEFFTIHRLLAFPVVDNGRILGVVDVDLYTRGLGDLGGLERSARGDDLFQLIGVHLTEYQQASPWRAFRQRIPWLACNFAGGILAAFLSGLFEAELQRVLAIAMFVPVVLALAEGVSIQSVSLALEMLRGRRADLKAIAGKLRFELLAGGLLGATSGVAAALVALAWLGHGRFALCVLLGIAGGMTCSAAIGLLIPSVLRLAKRDPRIAAGPIALAVADMTTLLLYFNLARWLL
jgi:magnesium transporter